MSHEAGPQRPIFRAEAVRRYIHSREHAVLPRYVSPRIFRYLWALLGLLAASGLLAWYTKLPVYASGPAIVVSQPEAASGHEALVVAAFVAPEYLAHLRAGQPLFLTIDGVGEHIRMPISTVEPEVSSPAAAQRRFALTAGAALAIRQPAAIVIARLEPPANGLPAALYIGSLGHADIEIGSRRALAFAPLIGHFFGAAR